MQASPIVPAPMTTALVAPAGRSLADGVDAVGKRFGEGAEPGVHAGRHLEEAALGQHRRAGEPAGRADADQVAVRTEVAIAADAVAAVAAADDRVDGDPLADPRPVGAGSGGDHGPGELVAHDQRRHAVRHPPR